MLFSVKALNTGERLDVQTRPEGWKDRFNQNEFVIDTREDTKIC